MNFFTSMSEGWAKNQFGAALMIYDLERAA